MVKTVLVKRLEEKASLPGVRRFWPAGNFSASKVPLAQEKRAPEAINLVAWLRARLERRACAPG
jgi:hypothetical protein